MSTERMDKFESKFESSRHDISSRGRRKSAASSKLKMERLASILKSLKDDEKQSKLRNEYLLRDFEKVNKLSVDLDTKARKLKKVKQEYDNYISTVYPHWKENVEMSRMRKADPPSEDLPWRREPCPYGQKDDKLLQKQGQSNHDMFPQYSKSRVLERDPRLSPPSLHFTKSNSINPYFRHGEFGSHVNDMPDRFMQFDHPKAPRDLTSKPVFTDQHHDIRQAYGISRGTEIHESELPLFDESELPFFESNVKSSVANQIRPGNLRIPRVKENVDISSFTILPQALALSPDGQLVLLPMAFSPQKSPTKDFRNATESPAIAPKMSKLNGNSGHVTFNSIDVTDVMVDKQIGETPQDPLTSTGKIPQDVTKPFSQIGTGNDKTNGTKNQDMLHENGSEVPQRHSIGLRGVVDERTVNVEEYDKLEKEIEGGIDNLNHVQVKADSLRGRQGVINDSHMAELNMGNSYSGNKEEVVSKPGTKLAGEIKGAFDIVSYRGSNADNMDSIITAMGNSQASLEPSNGCEQNKWEITDRVKIESAENLNDSSLSQEEGRKPTDLESSEFDLNELIDKYNNDDVIEETPFVEKDNGYQDVPQNEFMAKSREDYYNPKMNSNRFEPEEFVGAEELLSEEKEKKSMMGLDEVGIASRRRHEGLHSDKMFGNDKNSRDSFKLDNQDIFKEEIIMKNGRSQKNDRPLDMPEISYLFEEIENRMESVDRDEFYRKSIDDASFETLRRIKEILLSAGHITNFDTPDLCLVSRHAIAEFVGMNSKTGYIIKKDKDLSAIYTLDAFRDILSSNFEELWEYVFNHMELLVANRIFDNLTVCELFSKLLCPGNQTIAYEVSQAICRIMDIVDEGINYDVDEDLSFADEELTPIESDSSQNNVKQNNKTASMKNQDHMVTTEGVVTASETPSKGSMKSNDAEGKDSEQGRVLKELSSIVPVDKKMSKKETIEDDLLLDLGNLSSVSNNSHDNDDNDDADGSNDDGDDDSTFDSAKLSPHRTIESPIQPRNIENDDVDSAEEGTVSEGSFMQEANDLSKKVEEESENESDDNLEDLLSSSLVLESNRSKKDPAAGYKTTLPFFGRKQESFEVDDHKTAKRLAENSGKEAIASPQHPKSISSKFRKPGFWENSDTESEADDLNISAGNDLSNQNANEDEFDFEFFK